MSLPYTVDRRDAGHPSGRAPGRRFAKPLWRLAPMTVLAPTLLVALMLALPSRADAVTAWEPLAGTSSATPVQLDAALHIRNPVHAHPNIADLYVYWGARFGIRADLAFAQMLHETDSLRYGGLVQPWQNNFAGIGATGPGHIGYAYPSAEAGVIAHYQLLWDYINHRGVSVLRGLDGKWAVPGYGYSDAIARYATEIRYFSPYGNWLGSFNELPATPDAGLSTSIYFPWYDSRADGGFGGDWLVIANPGPASATAEVRIGGQLMRDPANPASSVFTIPPGGTVAPLFAGVRGGPVQVTSLTSQKLTASQRVLYGSSFSETAGAPAEQLDSSYWFSWYDFMGGDWVMVANAGAQAADVEIYVGGSLRASYSAAAGNAIAPGAVVTPAFAGLTGGPVRVVSTNGQPLIVSQRVLYRESFSEATGAPGTPAGSQHFFTWYDSNWNNGMRGDWVMVANAGAQAADVEIYVGGSLRASYSAAAGNAIAPGAVVTPAFAGLTGGPVRVVSTNGQPLIVSQRVLFKDSFEEAPGQPPAPPGGSRWLAWYDSRRQGYMNGDWLMIANAGPGDATVEIYISGYRMNNPSNPGNTYFIIAEGAVLAPQFPQSIGGPVEVRTAGGQQLTVSQRVVFNHMFER